MDAYGEYDDESTPPVREAECVDVVTGAWDAISADTNCTLGWYCCRRGRKAPYLRWDGMPRFDITSGRFYFLDKVEAFDLASGTWCQLPPLLKPGMRPGL